MKRQRTLLTHRLYFGMDAQKLARGERARARARRGPARPSGRACAPKHLRQDFPMSTRSRARRWSTSSSPKACCSRAPSGRATTTSPSGSSRLRWRASWSRCRAPAPSTWSSRRPSASRGPHQRRTEPQSARGRFGGGLRQLHEPRRRRWASSTSRSYRRLAGPGAARAGSGWLRKPEGASEIKAAFRGSELVRPRADPFKDMRLLPRPFAVVFQDP